MTPAVWRSLTLGRRAGISDTRQARRDVEVGHSARDSSSGPIASSRLTVAALPRVVCDLERNGGERHRARDAVAKQPDDGVLSSLVDHAVAVECRAPAAVPASRPRDVSHRAHQVEDVEQIGVPIEIGQMLVVTKYTGADLRAVVRRDAALSASPPSCPSSAYRRSNRVRLARAARVFRTKLRRRAPTARPCAGPRIAIGPITPVDACLRRPPGRLARSPVRRWIGRRELV